MSDILQESERPGSSFAHALLEVYQSNERVGAKQEWTLDDIKGAAGAIFIAGADTVRMHLAPIARSAHSQK